MVPGRRRPGPAWANSLFEDNAEFGLGLRLGLDQQVAEAHRLVETLAADIGEDLARDLLAADGRDATRGRRPAGAGRRPAGAAGRRTDIDAVRLLGFADDLVPRSVWIVGGDGWAYDIGFGGVDHVLASGRNVNLLVLDTEVYSNTGGQASKATPRGAVAKFASGGPPHGQEGPRGRRSGLRRRVRGPGGHGRQRRTDGQGPARGRGLARAVPGDRLQPLRGPRHRHEPDDGAHARRRALRPLAPLPLPPGRRRARATVPARQPPTGPDLPGVRDDRGTVRHARPQRSRAGRPTCSPSPRAMSTSAGATTSSWPGSSGPCPNRRRRSHDGPVHVVPRPAPAIPAGRLLQPGDGRPGRPLPPRRRRDRGGRAAVAVRGADRAGGPRGGPDAGHRRRGLRRGHRLLPRAGRLQHRPRPLPGPGDRGEGGRCRCP